MHKFGDKRAEAIGTQLRAAGLLPKGGRGPYAPDANEAEVALYTIAVGASQKVTDAVEAATTLAGIVDDEGNSLLRTVTVALSDKDTAFNIRHIRLFPHVPMAEVTLRDGKVLRYFTSQMWSQSGFVPEAQGQGFVGPIGHIGGAVLTQMALGFEEDTDEGEFVAD